MNPVIFFWAVIASVSNYQACIKEANLAQVCVVSNGVGKHTFSNLKYDTDYVFSYKADGVESYPTPYHTDQKKTEKPAAGSLIVPG